MKHLATLALAGLMMMSLTFRSSEKEFPELVGKSLEGKTLTFPRDLKGKYSLIGVAYSMKAQKDLETWIDPVSKTLINNIFYPINLYFVPMTGNIKVMSQDKIEAKIKESLDKSYYKYVVVYQGETETYEKQLDLKDKNKPYFLVVNPEGKVTYTTSGTYSDAKLEALTDHLSE